LNDARFSSPTIFERACFLLLATRSKQTGSTPEEASYES
jgi:hypothetical protein